jgi:hypothetical protein
MAQNSLNGGSFTVRKLRVVLGALIAPASAPLLYFLAVSLGSGYPESNPAHHGKLVDELLLALLPLSYAVSAVVGVPAVVVLRRLHKLDLWRSLGVAAITGAALGIIATYVFTGPPGAVTTITNRMAVTILAVIASSVIALASL